MAPTHELAEVEQRQEPEPTREVAGADEDHVPPVSTRRNLPSALFTAASLQIDCPRCGESLPAPCGSVFWTLDELTTALKDQPERTCDGCDEPFVLRQQSKAYMPLHTRVKP